jgi:hypothetical protein
MRTCILANSESKTEDILALQRLAGGNFDTVKEIIKTYTLTVVEIVKRILAEKYQRIYILPDYLSGRVSSATIALVVCLYQEGIEVIDSEGHPLDDDTLIDRFLG